MKEFIHTFIEIKKGIISITQKSRLDGKETQEDIILPLEKFETLLEKSKENGNAVYISEKEPRIDTHDEITDKIISGEN
jgi:hypothetical protein